METNIIKVVWENEEENLMEVKSERSGATYQLKYSPFFDAVVITKFGGLSGVLCGYANETCIGKTKKEAFEIVINNLTNNLYNFRM